MLSALLLGGCADEGPDTPWNVLVVTLDTTRADRLGPYGHPDAGTPTYDALAAEGFVFERASSAAPVTLPSHSTIFTGTYPPVHGVRDNGMFRLPDERTTLAEVLRDNGWDTGAAVASVPVTRQFGIAQGFDFFDDHVTIDSEDLRGRRLEDPSNLFFDERNAARINDAILPWLRTPRDRPFFAWIHYWDAHQPLHPPSPFAELYADDLYQGEIAYVDQSFGVVVDTLRKSGQWRNTLVVVVGDHGEGLGQHREDTHSILAYEATLHVPMILRVPGYEGGERIARQVGTVDLVPTILDLLGIEAPDEVQGSSLRPLLDDPSLGDRARDDRAVYYAETLTPRLGFGWGELRVLYHEGKKYIHGPRPELFDLHQDPDELDDLVAARPDEASLRRRQLQSLLDELSSEAAMAAVHEIDTETRQRLEALGYISGGGAAPDSIREELRTDGTPPQERVFDNSLMSSVKAHLGAGRWGLALEGARQLVALDPENTFYRGLMAQALLGDDRPAEAAEVMEALDELGASDDAILFNIARLLFSDGEEERAFRMVHWVLDQRESAAGLYLLGEMHAAGGDEEAALKALEAAVALDDRYPRAVLALAIRRAQRQERARAEELFESLVTTHPLRPRYRYNYAVFLLEDGRVDDAKAQLRRAVELGPWYWSAHLTLLALYVEVDDLEAAEALYRDVLARATDQAVLERADRLMSREAA
ncbi:MAG: sulfatase-like hydrolase/transferase [Acidobacteriota bacterium]